MNPSPWICNITNLILRGFVSELGVKFSMYPGARFSKVPETFPAKPSVFKDRGVYTPETSCMKRTSAYIKNMCMKQLCSHKV